MSNPSLQMSQSLQVKYTLLLNRMKANFQTKRNYQKSLGNKNIIYHKYFQNHSIYHFHVKLQVITNILCAMAMYIKPKAHMGLPRDIHDFRSHFFHSPFNFYLIKYQITFSYKRLYQEINFPFVAITFFIKSQVTNINKTLTLSRPQPL